MAILTQLVSAADHKVALVIGNGAYPTARLRNPVNDANAMASMLREVGFDVIVKTEANRRDMTRALTEFRGKLSAGSIALFYYAGHGMQVKGKNFLIPVDAEIDNEDMVATEGIDVERLFEQLKITRLNVVILDACRDNPFVRRGNSGGLAEIDAPLGTFLAYATAPGKVAADGAGANGLYTSELLKAIAIPGLKIEDVFKQVRIGVLKSSGNTQVPWESSSMTAEFYFRPDAKSAAVDVQLRRAERERIELQQEMEKLRAELIRLVGASQIPRLTGSATAAAGGNPAELSSPTAAASAASPASKQKPVVADNDAEGLAVWEKRIAIIDGLRGQLDYAKAISILLGIKQDDDLSNVVRFERFLNGSSWASALAMGIGKDGNPLWANASRYRTPAFAQETALESCLALAEPSGAATYERNAARCELVIINGDFQMKALLAVADRLRSADPTSARMAFLSGISRTMTERFTPGGQGTMSNFARVQSARVHTPTLTAE